MTVPHWTTEAIFCLALSFLPGCLSWIDGDRWSGEEEGFHYYLPAVSFKATPQTDGSVKLEKQLLPDPQQHYVLRPGSFLSAYRFEIKTSEGLLTSVQFNPNSSALAAAAAKGAGDLGKSYFEAAQAKRAAETAAETKANEAAAAAQIEYEVALTKAQQLEAAQAAGLATPQQVLDARIALDTAVVRLNAARRAAGLEALQNVPSRQGAGGAPGEPGPPQAMGPVFYRLRWHEGAQKYFLVASQQVAAETVSPPTPSAALSGRIKGSPITRRGGKDEMLILVTPSEPVASVESTRLIRGAIDMEDYPPRAALQPDHTIQVVLHDATPNGDYILEIRARATARPLVQERITVGVEVRPALKQ